MTGRGGDIQAWEGVIGAKSRVVRYLAASLFRSRQSQFLWSGRCGQQPNHGIARAEHSSPPQDGVRVVVPLAALDHVEEARAAGFAQTVSLVRRNALEILRH